MATKKPVLVKVELENLIYHLPEEADGFLEGLQQCIATIPDAYKASAKVEMGQEWQYGDQEFFCRLVYWRPENEKERLSRELKESQEQARRDEWQRKEYEALKKKFEGTNGD